ncbi:MAG: response regulator transcription factor [Melioribacteraceae bacterium]|nr:response regulator transcription factor [Melioribacteraceae bacterium]
MKNINCILIDDETEALDRLETLLTKFDCINILAKIDTPDKAIESIVELNPNLIFIDVEMPRQNGFDIVKKVREQNINPTFIFVTGYNHYAIKAIRNAAFDFLLKPVDIDELKDTLERFCKCREEKRVTELPEKLIKEYSLTRREVELIQLIAECKTSKEIAELLFISKNTVDTHRRNILEKTGKKSIMELLTFL